MAAVAGDLNDVLFGRILAVVAAVVFVPTGRTAAGAVFAFPVVCHIISPR
jgi:hypothetical protein